jgi:two-component system response regulator QseB
LILRLLLVEDDLILGDAIKSGLSQDGHNVDWIQNGNQASQALSTEQLDLLVLDLNLPGKSGISLLQEIRKKGNPLPVLILTARDTVEDRVAGLDAGADDYLPKPFELDELLARVRALLRRSKGRATPTIVHDELILDPAAHTVTLAGQPVDLSVGEFNLLHLLLDARGHVFQRRQLEEKLYGWNKDIESNTIEVYIHHLRKKLGSKLIRTIRGVGYVIDKP